jgi:hypothetical protein
MEEHVPHDCGIDADDRTTYLLDEIAHQLKRQADALERLEEQLADESEVQA